MKTISYLNKIIQTIFIKRFEPYVWRPLKKEIETILLNNGEGLYLANIKTAGSDFISKIIGLFSNNYSHTIIFTYYNNLSIMFKQHDLIKVKKNLNYFYGNTILDFDRIKTIVLSSANAEGIMCCDLSKYHNRKMTIRKIPFTLEEEKKCIEFLCNQINNPYDTTGLIGWIFKKWDDPDNYYCSEICYDACLHAGYKIALIDNPSPGDIEIYAAFNNWKNLYDL